MNPSKLLLVLVFAVTGVIIHWMEPVQIERREYFSNIDSVEYVCHSGRQHFVVWYKKPNGKKSWFVVAAGPDNHNKFGHMFAKECTGEEVDHPGKKD